MRKKFRKDQSLLHHAEIKWISSYSMSHRFFMMANWWLTGKWPTNISSLISLFLLSISSKSNPSQSNQVRSWPCSYFGQFQFAHGDMFPTVLSYRFPPTQLNCRLNLRMNVKLFPAHFCRYLHPWVRPKFFLFESDENFRKSHYVTYANPKFTHVSHSHKNMASLKN